MGAEVDGETLGATDGELDGTSDGVVDGDKVGLADGVDDGAVDGVAVGVADGALDGVADGALVGDIVGGQSPHKPGQSILTVKSWALVVFILSSTVLVGSAMPSIQTSAPSSMAAVKPLSNAIHVPSVQLLSQSFCICIL